MNGSEPITLIIRLQPNGAVEVNGPIQNKVLCYGLLGAAHDAIRDYKSVEEPKIAIISGAVAASLKDRH